MSANGSTARISSYPPPLCESLRVPKPARVSVNSLRVVAELAPKLAIAIATPPGPERLQLLEEVIGAAIDAGRESQHEMDLKFQRVKGELADREQVVELLMQKTHMLQDALQERTSALQARTDEIKRLSARIQLLNPRDEKHKSHK